MKERTLQFVGSFDQGGSERQALALTRSLKNEGSFDVFAATLNAAGVLKDEAKDIGLPEIPEFKLTSFYNANFVLQVRRCARYLRDNRIDLVHTHDFYTNIFGMAAASLAGVKLRIASKRETKGVRSRTQEFVERLAFARAHAVVANSEAVRDHLVESGIAQDKVRRVYNGIDIEGFGKSGHSRAEICLSLGLPFSDEVRFISLVANLRHAVKDVPMLLRAAKMTIDSRPDTHFMIAGEGGLEAGLKELAIQLGVAGNVHFMGRCTDIPALLEASYACVLTSAAEGFSNSILEYMAAGRPVVVTNVGGAAEAVADGVNGYLVDAGDDEAMARRLIDLLDDAAKASSFGIAGRKIVCECFSNATQLQNTLDLYRSYLGNQH